jgi:preprotein translocase subunit SecD
MNILKSLKTIKNRTMKTLYFISITFLFFLCSCNSETKTSGQKVVFGIHEIVQMSEISDAVIDTLKAMNVQIEKNQQQPVVGYISKTDSMALQIDLSEQNLKLVRTFYPVDKEKKYCAVVAIRPNSVIDNAYIKKTKVNGKNVEIYFNLEGANKWSDLTKQNIGKPVAFIIDNQIYAMPEINSEIRNGVALITNLENEIIANSISESLNSSISD